MGKRKADATVLHTNKHVKVGAHSNAATAATVAKAASKLSLSEIAQAAPAQHAAAGPQLAAKEQLAAQIQVKEKLLKLLRKQKTAADPATKARIQQKVDKLLCRQPTAAGALPPAAAQASQTALGSVGVQKLHALQKQQQKPRQPLAGIAPVLASTAGELARRAGRQQRFASDLASIKAVSRPGNSSSTFTEESIGSGWLALQGGFGSNMSLEKEYLRLTSVPKSEDVRPPEVLVQSLALVKQRWKKERCSYAYACSQLKSIRQDLTVQGVATELTRDAYETHARIALEAADLPEFRQCLARLKHLYRAGVDGNRAEFYGYGLLHAAALGAGLLSQELCQLPRDISNDPFIKHALSTVNAFRTGQYTLFIQRYADATRMTPYLMDALLPRIRAAGVSAMMTAYHPCRLPLLWVVEQLGFDTDQQDEAIAYLRSRAVVLDLAAMEVDTKATRTAGRVSK